MASSTGIILLGLGPGAPGHLTREAWDVLQRAPEVALRTRHHPVVAHLPSGLKVHSFDEFYDQEPSFESVYERIVATVLEMARRPEGVVYAVPGHPFVAEATGPEIARRAPGLDLPVRVVEGLSFLEPTLTALGLDPLPQLSIIDALHLRALHHPSFPPDAPVVVAQVYSRDIAAEVKLALMAHYPDEHPVRLVHAAGTDLANLEDLPLHAIDRSRHIGMLTSLFVPSLGEATSFESFQEIIAHLRAPEGCPWDRAQTHLSLRPYLLEEAYETLGALDAEDPQALQEELGDLLIQIVLHAQIAAETGEFTMAEILRSVHTKLVHRHPHVFGDLEVGAVSDVKKNWQALKGEERQEKGEAGTSSLSGVPEALPALAQADAYQERASRVGFDWPEIEGVWEKLLEEVDEVRNAEGEQARSGELGDLLFAAVNLARWYDVDAETALRTANRRFRERFSEVERAAHAQGRPLSEMTLSELDALWEAAKN